jgi:hypothetical protein
MTSRGGETMDGVISCRRTRGSAGGIDSALEPNAGPHCRRRIRPLRDGYSGSMGMDLIAGLKCGIGFVCRFMNPTGLVMCFGLRFGV